MEEKDKSKILICIIVILVVIIIGIAVIGIMGYKSINDKTNQNNENKQQNVINDAEDHNQQVNNNEQEEIIADKNTRMVEKTISLNGNNYAVKLACTYTKIDGVEYDKETEDEDFNYDFNSKYVVSINGKVIDIEKNTSLKGPIKETDINKIKDINGKEYLLVYTYIYNPSGNASWINLYIINPEDGKVIENIKHDARASYLIDEQNPLNFEVKDSNVIDYILNLDNNTLEKHKYTIENGKLKDTIEKTYKQGEFRGAGAAI